MTALRLPIPGFLLMLAACGGDPPAAVPSATPAATPDAAGTATPGAQPRPLDTEAVAAASPPASPPPRPIAGNLIHAEWATAENRDRCAPIAFTSDGGVAGRARRANFSGGWAVAFDTRQVRSAYGIAGPGLVPADEAAVPLQADRLRRQWPHFAALPALPAPAFAGYGLEGAAAYPADNPDAIGLPSLAYVRVGGQQCTYNVWSRMGRRHLETLLHSLRMP